MHLTPIKSVLEIGIGTGRIAAKVAPFCLKLSGIDISPKTIHRAKKTFPISKISSLSVLTFRTIFLEKHMMSFIHHW